MQKTRGFSLIELAVVLTVMAILSTAAVPGMIAAARGKYGERLVADINTLREAAEAYYHQHAEQWPEEGQCTMSPGTSAIAELKNKGFLTSILRDPFSGEHYLFSYAEQNGECHLHIHTPRNAKLSPILEKLNATLKLIGEQNCQAQNNLLACTFAFAEPKLGVNFNSRVEDEVEEQVVPIEERFDDKVKNVDGKVEQVDDRVDNAVDRIVKLENAPTNNGPSKNYDGSINNINTRVNNVNNRVSNVDSRVTTLYNNLNQQITTLKNSQSSGPSRYSRSFRGRYGQCAGGYRVEQCAASSNAKFCTASGSRASCEPSSWGTSGRQYCSMTCVK
ncbi:MAG: type II secretion system protein [Myxococcota bacterium]|jgi:prepilin-type N-terminal cleavage/methylation domain-containing protein|nr:type II secretion system protein [Myxococcota bacterium]